METMMVFRCTFVIFLLGLASTFAGYCGRNKPNCCLESGINQRSCNGSGTSDVTDLFSLIYQGKRTHCVAGRPGDIYRVWGVEIKFQRGIQSLAYFNGLYAFFFEIPASGYPTASNTFDYYILEMGRCPKLLPVKADTKGTVAGTNVPYVEVLQIAQFNNKKYFPAPCQALAGTFVPVHSNEDVALNTMVEFSLSGLSCIRYVTTNCSYNTYPATLIKEYGLYVKPGVNGNDGMYCQDGYPNGPTYTCRDPTSDTAVGYCLRRSGYNFNYANGPGMVCLLSQYVLRCFAELPLPYNDFAILTFVTPPFAYRTIIYVLEQSNFYYPGFQGLYSAAC